jgi:prepilin-type N-terminal cleavage/methylation domain-containing protein
MVYGRPRTTTGLYRAGLTLIEMVVVVSILGLFVCWVSLNLSGVLRRHVFRATAQEFVSALQTAIAAASESDRRYEVIVDLPEQTYLMREITTPDLSEVLDEEIMVQGTFDATCRAVYVEFDDGQSTQQDRAKFRAGHAGWQYGGKIVLLDEDDRPHTVLVHRLSRKIDLLDGDVELPMPQDQQAMAF